MPKNHNKIERLHHFDLLRAAMLLLIVLTHVAHAYDPTMQWIVESPDQTWLAPVLSSIPVFSMPGFFMISSILSIFLMRKRSYQDWAKGRLLRICVPLISGILILSPITIYVASQAAELNAAGTTSSPFTGDLGTDFAALDRRWIGHLWFLSTLGIFTLIAWIGFARGVLMDGLHRTSVFLVKLDRKINIWWTIVLAVGAWSFGAKALLYVMKLLLGFEPALIAILNVDTLLGYFPLFMLGLLLGVSSDLRDLMFKVTPFRTIVLAIGFAIYVLAAGVPFEEWRLARKLIGPALGTGIALFLFGYLADKINKPSPLAKRISSYSYSVYLLHYPISNALALIFASVTLNASLEFLILIILTYILSFVAAWVVAQVGVLKFLFNGEPFWRQSVRVERSDSKTAVGTHETQHESPSAYRAMEIDTAPNR
ncbi:MAG: acyltransferase family protein [Pseudomonadota bacterium]